VQWDGRPCGPATAPSGAASMVNRKAAEVHHKRVDSRRFARTCGRAGPANHVAGSPVAFTCANVVGERGLGPSSCGDEAVSSASLMPRDSTSFAPRPAEGLNHPNVMQMFLARVRKTPELTALRFKQDGTWRPLSWRAWEQAAREIAMGLIVELGVEVGDRVALMSATRVEWALCDLAIALCGAVGVPIYATSTGAEAAYVLADSGAKIVICEHPEHLRRIHEHERSLGSGSDKAPEPDEHWRETSPACLRHEVVLDRRSPERPSADDRPRRVALDELGPVRDGGSRTTLDLLRAAGRAALARVNDARPQIEAAIAEVGLEDPFTIVYTSGTTGVPKGVVLSHKNLVYEAWAIKNSIAVDRTDQHLLMLPMAHIFARHLLWAAVESGAVTAFAERMATAPTDMLEVAPTYVGAVPRFYEKIKTTIEDEFAKRTVVERRLIDWAFEIGRRVSVCRQRGQAIPPLLAAKHRAADKVVFEPIRARFGGKLRFFVSGAAPLGRDTAEFFHAAGLLILEGYGLTETTGATNVNRPDRFRFGTVGPALPGCEVLIGADREILLRGHNVMVGYHKRPADTAAVLDEDGWLHTGDVGEISEGFLRITDRLKDIIITAGGKNIAPQKLEGRLQAREGVAHVLVTGDRHPHLVALIGLDEAEMLAISARERLNCQTYADLARHPRIRDLVGQYVAELNRTLPSYETIKAFAIPPEPFAADLVTPTLKLKRKAVEARYAQLIASLYQPGSVQGAGSSPAQLR
jgi:long-chain acyl-CoA synthetase